MRSIDRAARTQGYSVAIYYPLPPRSCGAA